MQFFLIILHESLLSFDITIDWFDLLVLEIYSNLQNVYSNTDTNINVGQTQDYNRTSALPRQKECGVLSVSVSTVSLSTWIFFHFHTHTYTHVHIHICISYKFMLDLPQYNNDNSNKELFMTTDLESQGWLVLSVWSEKICWHHYTLN